MNHSYYSNQKVHQYQQSSNSQPNFPQINVEDVPDEPLKLLPTKVVSSSPHRAGESFITSNPDGVPRWTAQSVIDWLSGLALATEQAEEWVSSYNLDGMQQYDSTTGRSVAPILVGNVQLSSKAPLQPTWVSVTKSSPKRKEPVMDWEGRLLKSEDSDEMVHEDVPEHWNLHFLSQDPFSWQQGGQEIGRLAKNIEQTLLSSPNCDSSISINYQAVQTRLEYTFGAIVDQFPLDTSFASGELRFLLDALYRDIAHKLEGVLPQTDSEKESIVSNNLTIPFPDNENQRISSGKRGDLSSFMTAWLRDNWINPYPDDATLQQLARACETSPAQVSNWLINARTRKWRPAIVKATQLLHRPSNMLLHDSIHLFDGKPVQDLEAVIIEKEQAIENEHPFFRSSPPMVMERVNEYTNANKLHMASAGQYEGSDYNRYSKRQRNDFK